MKRWSSRSLPSLRACAGCGIVLLAAGMLLSACHRRNSAEVSAGAGDSLTYVPVREDLVALTFDDGPEPVTTPEVLEILAAHKAKATFFVVGPHAEKSPELLKTMKAAGHCIGNHTCTHPNFHKAGAARIRKELRDCSDAVERITGERPSLFRPPKGMDGENLEDICRDEGMVIVGWSGHGSDWTKATADEITEDILDRAVPGAILLLHDWICSTRSANRAATIDAVRRVVGTLASRGCRMVTVPELLARKAPAPYVFANGIRLLGSAAFPSRLRPSEEYTVCFFWDHAPGSRRTVARDFVAEVALAGADGRTLCADWHDLPRYKDVAMRLVERDIPIPRDAAAGVYGMRVRLNPVSGKGAPARLVTGEGQAQDGFVSLASSVTVSSTPSTEAMPTGSAAPKHHRAHDTPTGE